MSGALVDVRLQGLLPRSEGGRRTRLREIADDGHRPARTAAHQCTPLHLGELLGLVDDFIGSGQVGHDQLTCKVGRCDVVFTFSQGSLAHGTVTGWFAPSGNHGTGTVTGGTGSYAGMKGSFVWKNLNKQGSRTSVTLQLM